jgi:signal transduction histidine kinase
MGKIQSFFIGHHLRAAEDDFERAKIQLIFNFFIFYFIISICFIPYIFYYKIRAFTYINLGLYLMYIMPFAMLKFFRSYESASFVLSFSIVLSASFNSVFNNGLLTPNISVWFFIAVAFGAYVMRTRYTVALVVIMYICLSVIDWLKYNNRLFINPYFSEKANLNATPFIMVVTFPLILMLFIEYVRSKRRAISSFKTALREKDTILGKVAHDLRNPIGGAISCIDLYKLDKQQGKTQEGDRFLDFARESCERALGHIEELLDASALRDVSTRLLTVESVRVSPFVQSIIEGYIPRARKKSIVLTFETESDDVTASINLLKFSRVIENVIANAIKFTPDNGTISVNVSRDEHRACIRIADSGIGIPTELQANLFEEFTPSARPGTKNERSTGLGMSITKKIVELHGGQIWFDSEEGQGTTFYIALPSDQD